MPSMSVQGEANASAEAGYASSRSMLDVFSSAKVIFLVAPAFSGIFMSLGGLNFSIERIVAIVFSGPLVYLIWRNAKYERQTGIVCCWTARRAYLLWIVSLAISTLINDPKSHLSGYVLLVIPALYFFLFSTYSPNGAVVQKWTFWVMAYLGFSGLVDILVHSGHVMYAKGTVIEPNIFGSTLAIFILANIHRFRMTPASLTVFGLAFVGFIASFSRGPYLGFGVGLLTYVFLYAKVINHRKTKHLMMIAVVLASLCVLFSPLLWKFYDSHLNHGGTISVRGIVIAYAIQHFLDHPIWGNGALDGGYSSVYLLAVLGNSNINATAIWQMMVSIAHDSGIVGLTFYTVFLISLFIYGYRAVLQTRDPRRVAYLAAAIAGLIASQTTTIHYMAVSGVILGLLGSAYVAPSRRQDYADLGG